jgi:MFS family permease
MSRLREEPKMMSRLLEEPTTPMTAARSWWPSWRSVRQMRTGRLAAPQPTRDRQARAAVAALFLTNGALFANLLPRYPEIKADLGLSNAAYGVAVAAFSVGALISGPSAASLIRRFGSSRVAVWGSVGIALFAWLAGVAPSAVTFAGALFVAGGADAVTDVAQNAHGLRVQRRYGRSIINSFHAVWSAGAILGGAMGAGAIALHIPRGTHLGISAVVFVAVCAVAYRFLLPGLDEPASAAKTPVATSGARVATYAALAALVTIAIAAAIVEDAGSSWATLYVRELGAPGAIAVFGYIAAVGFQFIGRVLGDRLVDRFGQRAVARCGGVIAAVGMGAALVYPSVPAVIAGFAAAGFGVATLIPAAMQRADELPGLKPGTGLTAVTWLMRVGFVCAPMIVGALADAFSLRIGLLTVPVAGVAVIALAGALTNTRRR